ncbi:uncharacterized protein PFL1_06190 [Pseudozyma flocculosa PF-1]|uniref:YABBY protein C-terminal domain-containing protein n=1 Tax=Pseudozyma flocculosa PF-1 TaxID=1277687 RepID=A0A061H332_9BASI|nr:uncharacterized protein PFL1_06190 [Pseudozyma flocculosa PF-1]EPQ26255.1 hypothetical protein PFL1_06190 [Pseudozyma flocculosa PF-1]
MPPKKSTGGGKKKSTAYHRHMKETLAKLKTEKPNMEHKERFKQAAHAWATVPGGKDGRAAAMFDRHRP